MNVETAIDLFKTTILFALYIVSPFLGTLLVISLVASILQSVTSMQENTLTFAPKLVVMAAVGILLAPWLIRSLSEFTLSMLARMPALAH
jgi:flagellar biosynthetic protein FliQ